MKKNIIIALLLIYSIATSVFIWIIFYENSSYYKEKEVRKNYLHNENNPNAFWVYPDENMMMNIKKPVIYLYPEKKEKVKVSLDFDWELIYTYPEYDKNIWWWEVEADSNSNLVDKNWKKYNYLFWEWNYFKMLNIDETKWFVVKWENSTKFLEEILPKMWLNPKEYNDFIVYWAPQMQKNKYNFIYFMWEDYEKTAKLNIIPKPDSILRIFMVFKWLENDKKVEPQTFLNFQRKWFSVVEWGWTEIKK